MERKDYLEKFTEIKNDILNEVRNILGYNGVHSFKESFFIHYVEGEVATTETCSAVRVDGNGMVIIEFYRSDPDVVYSTEGESVFLYEPESFLDILDNLKKELREIKLEVLRNLVKDNGNRLEFDNKFRFTGFDGDSECEYVGLLSLSLKEDGKLNIEDEWQGGIYDNSEKFIPDSELDRFIEYVKEKVCETFTVKATETFSRIFEVKALSYKDACEKVRQMLLKQPFTNEDSDGLSFM